MHRPDLASIVREAHFFDIAGGGVVYRASSQRLYVLNAPAALAWCDLGEGRTPDDTRQRMAEFFGLDAATAEDWRRLALASFDALIGADAATASAAVPAAAITGPPPMAPAPLPAPHRFVTYSVLGQRVYVAAPAAAFGIIDTLLGHLRGGAAARPEPGDLWISVEAEGSRFRVTSANDPPTEEDAETLAPDIERRIVQDAVPRAPHFLAFHAALLRKGARAILLAAPAGSGKTTLALALAAAGWSLVTDEMALLGRDLIWRGLPFRPCAKRENFATVRRFCPEVDAVMEHVRYSRRVKYLPVPVDTGTTALDRVVFPRFEAGRAAELVAIPTLQALERLVGQSIYVPPGFSVDDVDRLLEWQAGAGCETLVFGDAEAAAALLDGHGNGKNSQPVRDDGLA